MAWPNDRVPAGGPVIGPTATEHLDDIVAKASLAATPLLARIVVAANACKLGTCIVHATRKPGAPPPDGCQHGQFILWARCHADESNWGLCADELEHGT
jgi:hypothetical protein